MGLCLDIQSRVVFARASVDQLRKQMSQFCVESVDLTAKSRLATACKLFTVKIAILVSGDSSVRSRKKRFKGVLLA